MSKISPLDVSEHFFFSVLEALVSPSTARFPDR
jgi:hypothetical protein